MRSRRFSRPTAAGDSEPGVLRDLEAADEISGQADRLLLAADAYSRFPTAVHDLVRVSRLNEAAD